MSLKHVHVLFVVASTLLILFCGVQAVAAFRSTGSSTMAGAAVLALAAVGLLLRYELMFLRRCREAGI